MWVLIYILYIYMCIYMWYTESDWRTYFVVIRLKDCFAIVTLKKYFATMYWHHQTSRIYRGPLETSQSKINSVLLWSSDAWSHFYELWLLPHLPGAGRWVNGNNETDYWYWCSQDSRLFYSSCNITWYIVLHLAQLQCGKIIDRTLISQNIKAEGCWLYFVEIWQICNRVWVRWINIAWTKPLLRNKKSTTWLWTLKKMAHGWDWPGASTCCTLIP